MEDPEDFVYHVTYFRNLDSIAEEGITPGNEPAIGMGSIRASKQNSVLNQMEHRFKFFLGSADAVSGQFNLILANLQAPTHMEMFDHYRRLLPLKGDLLVVSGFDDAHAASIEKELAQREFVVVEQVKVYGTTAALVPESSFVWVGFGLKRISSDP